MRFGIWSRRPGTPFFDAFETGIGEGVGLEFGAGGAGRQSAGEGERVAGRRLGELAERREGEREHRGTDHLVGLVRHRFLEEARQGGR